jgi:hypothetical protein
MNRRVGGGVKCRAVDHRTDILHPGADRAQLDELGVGVLGDESRERGLAASRRSPENHGRRLVAFDQNAKGFTFSKEMILADELRKDTGPHALCQGGIIACAQVGRVAIEEVHYRPGGVL